MKIIHSSPDPRNATENNNNITKLIKIPKKYDVTQCVFRYDCNKDGYLCRNELKRMMIKRRIPWTENSLSQLIQDVDKDKDGKLTFREVC